jgi:hypothetical protein
MKLVNATFVLSALAAVSGCVAIPADPGYYSGPPAYYSPAPAYYAPPVFYGPSIGISVSGGHRGGGRHWRR